MKHIIQPENLKFVLGSDKSNNGAQFTIKSISTGKDFTYKINRKLFNGKMYTHVYVETEYLAFKRLGTYFNGRIWKKGEDGKQAVVESLAAKAIAYVLHKVDEQKFSLLQSQVEICHLGNCLRCGKTLTDSTSIEIGLGPICRNL